MTSTTVTAVRQGIRKRWAPRAPELTPDPFDEFARFLGYTPAKVAAIALGDDYAEFLPYLRATRTEITTTLLKVATGESVCAGT